jgi:hypothetical protein
VVRAHSPEIETTLSELLLILWFRIALNQSIKIMGLFHKLR